MPLNLLQHSDQLSFNPRPVPTKPDCLVMEFCFVRSEGGIHWRLQSRKFIVNPDEDSDKQKYGDETEERDPFKRLSRMSLTTSARLNFLIPPKPISARELSLQKIVRLPALHPAAQPSTSSDIDLQTYTRQTPGRDNSVRTEIATIYAREFQPRPAPRPRAPASYNQKKFNTQLKTPHFEQAPKFRKLRTPHRPNPSPDLRKRNNPLNF